MRKIYFLIHLLALTLLITGCEPSAPNKHWQLAVFDPATHQTRTLTQQDVTHKLLVINYWAEWCKPCIAEIPELNRFAQAEAQRAVVIGVNFDNKQSAELETAIQKANMAFPVTITKPDSLFTLPEISGLPTTLILDEHGVLKKQLLGPQTYESLKAAIAKP